MRAIFRIKYNTEWGQNLFLVARDKKYPMKWGEGAVWCVTIPKFTLADLEDYTYVVMRDGCIERTEWKHHSQKVPKGTVDGVFNDKWLECPIKGCPFPREHQAAIFDRPGFRGAGTAVPIFSLRSAAGFGIGEFRDLHPLIDWASATGQCVIQLLPINDTTRDGSWGDSYPYKPVSSFALNPMYIRLEEIGVKDDAAFCRKRKALNKLPDIDYPAVYKAKTAYMRKAFEVQGQDDIESSAYKKFCKDNAYWLDEYSAFCAERDSDSPDFHRWIQYHLEKQLKEEVAYARSKGVSLKGDLPIGVSADSADARFHPELFNLDSRAGAPPDFFSKEGQNWGFPTYNWKNLKETDYSWWKDRLKNASKYYDAYRLD
ncbi:MAG: 4-alpha-glucanotransferase, partial [Bacteroidales bacterium]|nr:4-alpha-glucanotransferase [Bacteroidales bacterium]